MTSLASLRGSSGLYQLPRIRKETSSELLSQRKSHSNCSCNVPEAAVHGNLPRSEPRASRRKNSITSGTTNSGDSSSVSSHAVSSVDTYKALSSVGACKSFETLSLTSEKALTGLELFKEAQRNLQRITFVEVGEAEAGVSGHSGVALDKRHGLKSAHRVSTPMQRTAPEEEQGGGAVCSEVNERERRKDSGEPGPQDYRLSTSVLVGNWIHATGEEADFGREPQWMRLRPAKDRGRHREFETGTMLYRLGTENCTSSLASGGTDRPWDGEATLGNAGVDYDRGLRRSNDDRHGDLNEELSMCEEASTSVAEDERREQDLSKRQEPVFADNLENCSGNKMIAKEVVRALRALKDVKDIDSVLCRGGVLSLETCSMVLQQLGLVRRADLALGMLEWMLSRGPPAAAPNIFTYNAVLGALKANKRWDEVQVLLGMMEAANVAPDVVTYNTLIGIFDKKGLVDAALWMYEDMIRMGIKPTPYTHKSLLCACSRAGRLQKALEFFDVMRAQTSAGVPVHKLLEAEQMTLLEKDLSCTCEKELRRMAFKENKVAGAVQLADRILASDIVMAPRLMRDLLIGACRTTDIEGSAILRLYNAYLVTGAKVDRALCNEVMVALGRAKLWWASLAVYEGMKQQGPASDRRSDKIQLRHFQQLLSSARRRRQWKWSLKLLQRMQAVDLAVDRTCWRLILSTCAAAGATTEAVHVFDQMAESKYPPEVVEYGLLLSALEKSDLLEKALEVWDHMSKRGIQPNVHAFTTLISAHGKRGDYGRAVAVFEEMRMQGCLPNTVTYNALISICAYTGQGARAAHWLSQMQSEMLAPDSISYKMAVEALVNEGLWRKAIDVYMEAQKQNVKLCQKTSELLLKACKINNDKESVDLLQQKRASSIAMDFELVPM